MIIVEQLEQRRLYSVTVSEGYPGYYEIDGDNSGNNIQVSVSQGDQTFTLDGQTYQNVEHIAINSGDGNDNVVVTSQDGDGEIAADVNAGGGDDYVNKNFDGTIWGGSGNDIIVQTDAYYSEVFGGDGNDNITLSGDSPDSDVHGGAGDDVIDARGLNCTAFLYGEDGNDTIYGSQYDDVIDSGTGSNALYGFGGNDTIYTQSDYDTVYGGDGYDVAYRTGNGGINDSVEEISYY